jgi:hypothetical protein
MAASDSVGSILKQTPGIAFLYNPIHIKSDARNSLRFEKRHRF